MSPAREFVTDNRLAIYCTVFFRLLLYRIFWVSANTGLWTMDWTLEWILDYNTNCIRMITKFSLASTGSAWLTLKGEG